MRTKSESTTTKKPPARADRIAGRSRGTGLPRGYGAMRDVPLALDPRIDLTKPIYEQAVALEGADEEEGLRRQSPRP
jgi:hypothetical protein